MKNILITGANGQLGRELSYILPGAILTDKDDLDITNERIVKYWVDKNNIDTIVNCAAYTAVDKAEEDIKLATKINVDGPRNLAKSGAKIIHISTDYVFDGNGHKPYQVHDKTNPLSVYGKTKLAGEKEVLKYADNAIIIRTAWLYSPYGNNFVKTMRRLGNEKTVSVVSDQIGTPTYAYDLAETIVQILPQMTMQNRGIYHFTNEGVCSWYDFAHEIMKMSDLKCEVIPIPSSAYPTRARRPYYSVLDKSKIKDTFGIKINHWATSLQNCLQRF